MPNTDILFYDDLHEQKYNDLCSRMKYLDEYHRAAAYLLSLDRVCREHIEDLFDLQDDAIIPEGLLKGWQTGTSRKTSRLCFNLWNGKSEDPLNYTGDDTDRLDQYDTHRYYTPDEIFCCSYAPYYWQAIKLRYPDYTEL